MAKIGAENVTVGTVLKFRFGTHAVISIEPYTGPFDFILNTLVLSNGAKMSNARNARYEHV